MNKEISPREYSLIQNYIKDECGIDIGDDKSYLIETRLSGMLKEFNCSSYEQLYNRITQKNDRAIAERVIDAITTNETMWFRDKTPWNIMKKILLPQYITQLKEGKKDKIRIWSAGCSTGQEPYSTAIVIYDYLEERGLEKYLPKFEIIATDISSTVLQIATQGKYDNISIMRGLPQEIRDEHFTNKGRIWVLDSDIIDMVDFRRFNLQESFIPLGNFDIIFCRYVMIYFSAELKKQLVTKFHKALNANGTLFIGSSEVFQDYRDFLERRKYEGGVYYHKKGAVL